MQAVDTDTVTAEIVSLEVKITKQPPYHLTFHFLSKNRFWIETTDKIGSKTGPEQVWYRLSGPGELNVVLQGDDAK